MASDFEVIGLKELQRAVKRNPQKVADEADTFLTRGMAKYKAGIIRNPWRMGGSGGGSPVSNDPRYPRKYQKSRSGNLRDSHRETFTSRFERRIGPTASYAPYVHGLKGYPRKRSYQLRPWLDYVKQSEDNAITQLYRAFLQNIVKDLAT